MTDQITIGLARIHYEFGEKRDFLPNFVAVLGKHGAKVVLEYGYGSGMGFTEEDYLIPDQDVTFASHEDIFKQDYVLVLRCPNEKDLRILKPGTCIISMMHYPTRPQRVALLQDLRSVAWNGLEVAFHVLLRTYPPPGVESPERGPIQVTILGVGAVGMHAVQAASRYGDNSLWHSLAGRDVPGIIVTTVEYDLTGNEAVMKDILSRTDILVDATQRLDVSKAVIPNEWIAWMPKHAVLVDLSVDPYDCSVEHREVKGIEGIPQGNLDQFVFAPDDSAFDRVPSCVSTKNRRYSVSCYSWPGLHPKEGMDHYGKQILPILRTLIERGGVQNIHAKGKYLERAISRAMLSNFGKVNNNNNHNS
jgi:alanine dehydrogenase